MLNLAQWVSRQGAMRGRSAFRRKSSGDSRSLVNRDGARRYRVVDGFTQHSTHPSGIEGRLKGVTGWRAHHRSGRRKLPVNSSAGLDTQGLAKSFFIKADITYIGI
jgi:hypothetical protein